MRYRSLFFAVVASLFLVGCGQSEEPTADVAEPAGLSDLVIEDVVEGEGMPVQAGQRAEMHYTVWLHDPDAEGERGKFLQTSKERGQTYTFMVGNDSVIQGWHQGVPGMKVGGTRVLKVPSRLAYGARGAGSDIPPHSDIIFELDLVSIQ